MSTDYIDEAEKWFEAHLPELLKSSPDKWIVIFDGRSLGVFDDYPEAYAKGVALAKSEKIVIKQIRSGPEKPIDISVNITLGLFDGGSSKRIPRADIG